MPDFPAHASPAFAPRAADLREDGNELNLSSLTLSERSDSKNARQFEIQPKSQKQQQQKEEEAESNTNPPRPVRPSAAVIAAATRHQPPPLVSPAFTPPTTPGTRTPNRETETQVSSFPIDDATSSAADDASSPELVEALPEVTCVVRARIPTTTGQEMFLHLYHNNVDDKEHLAIVFGSKIRSRSLDAPREGESEWDRMVRGAYVGRLRPGRTSSRMDATGAESQQNSADGEVRRRTEGEDEEAPLVRIHSACYTGETVWSARCDCGEQLDEAARLMSTPSASSPNSHPSGVIVYLQQEGRGIGLANKLAAYNLQDLGSDTYEANILLRHPADARSYGLATAMLVDLGLGGERGIRLLTNNPDKVRAVEGPNREVRVVRRVSMIPLAWKSKGEKGVRSEEVEKYLSTKIEKFHHMLNRG